MGGLALYDLGMEGMTCHDVRLDPLSLATVGLSDLAGALGSKDNFTAPLGVRNRIRRRFEAPEVRRPDGAPGQGP